MHYLYSVPGLKIRLMHHYRGFRKGEIVGHLVALGAHERQALGLRNAVADQRVPARTAQGL